MPKNIQNPRCPKDIILGNDSMRFLHKTLIQSYFGETYNLQSLPVQAFGCDFSHGFCWVKNLHLGI